MKRNSPDKRAGMSFRRLRANFSDEQLQGIGWVAMSFNAAEREFHNLIGPCLRFPSHSEIVASRISGMDGIAAIIRAGAKNLIRLDKARVDAAKKLWRDLDLTLDAFLQAKGLRDAVIHANIFDVDKAIGTQYGRQEARRDVLLTTEALTWLSDTCLILHEELEDWRKVLEAGSTLFAHARASDEVRAPFVQAVIDATAPALAHRTRRQSLGPMPKFPPEPTARDYGRAVPNKS